MVLPPFRGRIVKTTGGVKMLSTIDRTSPDSSTVSEERIGRLRCVRGPVQLFGVVLTAATLAACAQMPVAANRSSLVSVDRDGAPTPHRTASSVTGRRVAVVTRSHRPFVRKTRTAEASGGSVGLASFYGHSSQTASGEKFDENELTAAHRTLPFGTRVRVTNVATGESVVVRINDRGPFVHGRVLDVSHAAATTLRMTEQGVAKVKLDVVQ